MEKKNRHSHLILKVDKRNKKDVEKFEKISMGEYSSKKGSCFVKPSNTYYDPKTKEVIPPGRIEIILREVMWPYTVCPDAVQKKGVCEKVIERCKRLGIKIEPLARSEGGFMGGEDIGEDLQLRPHPNIRIEGEVHFYNGGWQAKQNFPDKDLFIIGQMLADVIYDTHSLRLKVELKRHTP